MTATAKQQESPLVAVDSPIINSPFREPEYHWQIERGKPPVKAAGRRRASYFYRVPEHAARGKKNKKQAELFEDAKGEEVELEVVNLIRERVKEWRGGARSGGIAYDGASPVTKELLELWQSNDRMQRLFFAQVEAAEAIIFLIEAAEIYRKGIPEIPVDEPGQESKAAGVRAFVRYACKMATGSGKTTVMGMLAAWSILNRVLSPRDDRFSDTVLIVCPNVTIRERLQELNPALGDLSLYRTRQLVPVHRMEDLRRGEVMIANWHRLAKKETNVVNGDSAKVDGAIVYNSDHNILQYCAGTEWKAIVWNAEGGPSDCPITGTTDAAVSGGYGAALATDGTYIYGISESDGVLHAQTFNGATWSADIAAYTLTDVSVFMNHPLWTHGGYIYVADGNAGVRAFSLDGSAFTLRNTYDTPGTATSVHGDNTYVYVADGTSGIRALTFNGTTFSLAGTPYNPSGHNYSLVFANGGYIFAYNEDSDHWGAFSFNGSTFTSIDTYSSWWGTSIGTDGTYLYVPGSTDGTTCALTFNGTAFAEVACANFGMYGAAGTVALGGYLYAYPEAFGVRAATFDGSTFTSKGIIFAPTYSNRDIMTDGTYIYAGGLWGSVAFRPCSPGGGGGGGGSDSTPDAFTFTDQTAVPAATQITSATVQITGIDTPAAISVSGASGTPEFQICFDSACNSLASSWDDTAITVTNNQYVRVRLTSSGTIGNVRAATLNVGGVSDDFSITTGDSAPSAYTFSLSLNQTPSTQVTSNIVQITGIDLAVATSIAGSGSPQYRTCSDASCTTEIQTWTSGAATISNNQYIQLRATTAASGALSATVTVGTGTTATGTWYFSTGGKGYFVLSSMAGMNATTVASLANADSLCLTNLTANNWMDKAGATVDGAHVRAFLCGSGGCNNLQANTIYQFAKSNAVGSGGAVFMTNGSGAAPGAGDATAWDGATYFGASPAQYWTGRATGGPPWATTQHANHCTNWTTTAGQGRDGNATSTGAGRWTSANTNCNTTTRTLVCFVNP